MDQKAGWENITLDLPFFVVSFPPRQEQQGSFESSLNQNLLLLLLLEKHLL